jgi:TRAP-type C4-dicarboxylate transport system permease small subunit
MKQVVKCVQMLSAGLAMVAGFATFFIMVMIATDVVLRFMGSGVPGALEIITYYMMIIVAFLALGNLESKDGMISVDVVYNVLPYWARRWMMVLACTIGTLVFAGMTYASFLEAVSHYRSGSYVLTLKYILPIWPSYIIIPIAFAVATLVSFLRTILALFGPSVPAELHHQMGLSEMIEPVPAGASSVSGVSK